MKSVKENEGHEGVVIRLNDGLSPAEFGKVLNPYAHNELDNFSYKKAGEAAALFVDENKDAIMEALDILATPAEIPS